MKKFYLAFTFALIAFSANAQQQPFITTWEVTANDLSIEIPTTGTGYNYTIDFGDSTIQNNVTGSTSHTYSSAGIYTVSITGSFPRICFGCAPLSFNPYQLLTIEQWGDIQWQSMESAFEYAIMTINAIDAPDLSQVTNMSGMFKNASFHQSIDHWNVSNIINMSKMFYHSYYDQPLNNWDVSNVVNMSYMFYNAGSFNQPLNNWDVSNVTNMEGMFSEASQFNQPLNNWDVSNVINMSHMFHGDDYPLYLFNQPLNNWDVSNVTDMSYMFAYTKSFNQPIGSWNVSSVIDMNHMFYYADQFNKPIDSWNVSNVTDMSYMFYFAEYFNNPINNWNVSNVTDMSYMFYDSDYNQPLNNWDVSSVTNMNYMFYDLFDFDQPLNNWNVSNVTDMTFMFAGTSFFDQPLNNWDVSNVTNMNGMFVGALRFNQPLNNWDVSNVTNMNAMFGGAFSFNQPLNNWDVSNVTDMGSMFSFAYDFNQPINNWNVSNVIDMYEMFHNAYDFNQPINNWNVSNVTNIVGMFHVATSFNQDLTDWQNINGNLGNFLSHSDLDINNYNAFLSHLASLGINNGELGATYIEYCNQGAHNYLTNNLGWTIYDNGLSSDCNTITGTILYDQNNNGCDPNDLGANGVMVNINDGTYNFTTSVENGSYNTAVAGTSFTVSVINHPGYFSVNPPTATIAFGSGNTAQQDFCVTANQGVEDLNITLLPISQARPGFEADYHLVVKNMGTQTVANTSVILSFDDTKQSFTSASPIPTSTTANQLTFGLSNLLPFETRTIGVTMQTFTPPTVNGGDVLSFTTAVAPNTNDHTPADNTFMYDQTVVNSFDPNDKQVLQGEEIFISEADEYLNYLIRFQNTGTASAINVRILDTLHPKLDYSTIQLVNASHTYRVEITDGNHVEFIFENINLPHEAVDEPGSHGFVAYKIKPKSNVQIGDIITGNARIYFDFNAPIITNTVSTEIVENLSTENVELHKIRLYPNPTSGILNISSEAELEKVELFSITGNRLLLQESNMKKIDLHQFSSGIYFLKITDNSGTETVEKIVKK